MTVEMPLLHVKDLRVEYRRRGFRVPPFVAIQDMSVDVLPGTTVGVVGESGSGKSTLGRAVLGLAPVTAGRIVFAGRDISHASAKERRALSADLQVIFQDPLSSLNPALTVESILAEPLVATGTGKTEARARIAELLDIVGLPTNSLSRLPREFSGGQRQRIAIARAIARRPKLIVCDEATSALDVSTQARVLDLLLDIQIETGVSYLFITHDLDVVDHMSDEIVVVRNGEIVERGPAEQVVASPTQAYTQRLLAASPVADPARQAKRRAAFRALPAPTLA